MLSRNRPFDIAFAEQVGSGLLAPLTERDKALARAIAATTLRRKGQIDAIFNAFLERPLKGRTGLLLSIVRTALAEILFMDAPDHAVVNLAVHQARDDRNTKAFAGLLNAILRRAAGEGPAMVASQDVARINTPRWLWDSWAEAHGDARARAIAEANRDEAPLDLTVKADAEGWARRLGGEAVAHQTVRLEPGGRIEALEGFDTGAWWVQDAAAALPARLLGEVAGLRVADLCAAPGGKTAQLAAAGAEVTAVDISRARLKRLAENLARLELSAKIVESDILKYAPEAAFDAVLLDAPCSATGTIRRHPDIPHLKGPDDIARLVALQRRLLEKAATMVAPGGVLVYCTCSLQRAEGEARIEELLAGGAPLTADPIAGGEVAGYAHSTTPEGYVRTWPFGDAGEAAADGFFIARLKAVA